eukprot:2780952-Prymnesium_polylepis.1
MRTPHVPRAPGGQGPSPVAGSAPSVISAMSAASSAPSIERRSLSARPNHSPSPFRYFPTAPPHHRSPRRRGHVSGIASPPTRRCSKCYCDHDVCGAKRRGEFLGLMMLKARARAFLSLLKAKSLEKFLALLLRQSALNAHKRLHFANPPDPPVP